MSGKTVWKCVEGHEATAAELVAEAKRARGIVRSAVHQYNVEV